MRLQDLVLERRDLRLLRSVDGLELDVRGSGRRIVWERLIPIQDYATLRHGSVRNKVRTTLVGKKTGVIGCGRLDGTGRFTDDLILEPEERNRSLSWQKRTRIGSDCVYVEWKNNSKISRGCRADLSSP